VSEHVSAAVAAGRPDAASGHGPSGLTVTVSATYGAGGSVVGPALAARLGVPFLQRVTTSAGALAGPGSAAERLSAGERSITPVHRLFASLTQAMPAGPTLSPPSSHRQDDDLRRRVEAEIRDFVAAGSGVILGRAAAVVLGKDHGFHVRLDGPPARRLAQGAAIEGISIDEARAHLQAADDARRAYVRRLYRVDPADPSLYHFVVDSTALPLDAVIELILSAARDAQALRHGPRQSDDGGAPSKATSV
jgi:cytidylate kinase